MKQIFVKVKIFLKNNSKNKKNKIKNWSKNKKKLRICNKKFYSNKISCKNLNKISKRNKYNLFKINKNN